MKQLYSFKHTHVVWILFLVLSLSSKAQSYYTWDTDFVATNWLRNSFVLSDDFIVAAGNDLTFTKSEDGGTTWQAIATSGTPVDGDNDYCITGMHFLNEQTGFSLIGPEEYNYGEPIINLNVLFPNNPSDPYPTDNYVCKTIDGGQTWSVKLALNDSINFQDIHFFDNQHGLIVGGKGAFYETFDAGETWQTGNLSTTKHLERIQFIDSQNGYILATEALRKDPNSPNGTNNYIPPASHTLFRTTDGGSSWQESTITSNTIGVTFDMEVINDVVYVTERDFIKSYLTGPFIGNRIHKSQDGGVTWNVITEYTIPHNLYCLKFKTEDFGYVSGGGYCDNTGCYQTSVIYKTEDGGMNWELVWDKSLYPGPEEVQDIYNINFVNDHLFGFSYSWSAIDDGTIIKTSESILSANENEDISQNWSLSTNQENIKLTLSDDRTHENLNIQILDLTGKVIFTQRFKGINGSLSLDKSQMNLQSSCYIINVESDGQMANFKFFNN